MLRDVNLIYHREPYDKSLQKQPTKIIARKSKLSEKRDELKRNIAMCKFQLSHAGPGIQDEYLERIKKKLAKYEKELANLPEQMQHKVKRTYKKLSQEKIREYTLKWIEDAKKQGHRGIMAEEIAYQLQVKVHCVKQVLQQLNIEGVLYQPAHDVPHDSNRDRWCHFRGNSMWGSDIYYFREKEEEEGADGLLE